MTDPFILETRQLTKEFKGFVAVRDVNLKVGRGSVHALIGPNGAGKTTCFNLLTHFLEPTRGRIFYKGRDITGSGPAAIARMGLIRSFQISAVFPHLSVLENVRIALQRKRGASFDFWRTERLLAQLDGRASFSNPWDWRTSPTRSRSSCRTGASARSRSRPPLPSSPSCCCSTSRPREWRTRTSSASRR